MKPALPVLIAATTILAISIPPNPRTPFPFPLLKPITHPPSLNLSTWPTSPFLEYIYEPNEYLSINHSWPTSPSRAFLVSALRSITHISNTEFPPSTDTKLFSEIHIENVPVTFDLRTTEHGEEVTGWKVVEMLAVVQSIEQRYGAASFVATYVRDGVEVARLSIKLAEEVGR